MLMVVRKADDDDESQATVGFGDPHQGCEHAGP